VRVVRDAVSRRWIGATRYHTRIVLYTEVDAQCDKVAKVVGRTSTVAGVVNLVRPVYHTALSSQVDNTCDARRAVAKLSKFRV